MAAPEAALAPAPPPLAPGEVQYNAMVANVGKPVADEWKADESQKLIASGKFSPTDVDAWFGAKPLHAPAVAQHTQDNMAEKGLFEGLGDYVSEEFQAGVAQPLQDLWKKATGPQAPPSLNPLEGPAQDIVKTALQVPLGAAFHALVQRPLAEIVSRAPVTAYRPLTSPFDTSTLAQRALTQGQTEKATEGDIGTAAFMLLPEAGGAHNVGAEAMGLAPEAAAQGANVAPTALREHLVDSYNKGGVQTFSDAADVAAGSIQRAARPGTEVDASQVKQAYDGRIPDQASFYNAAAEVTSGGKTTLATDEAIRRVTKNTQELYKRTGITPWQATDMAAKDPAFRQELLQQDPYGQPVMPLHQSVAPSEHAPPTKTDLTGSASTQTTGLNFEKITTAIEGGVSKTGENLISPKGAFGVHQIMPGTARQYGLVGDDAEIYQQLSDPKTADLVFSRIQSDLERRYPGDTEAQLAAYNAGPGRANALVKEGPGTRLVATPDKSVRGGIRYDAEPSARNEANLPMETQKYLANARRKGGGELPEGHDGTPSWSADSDVLTQEQKAQEAEREAEATQTGQPQSAGAASVWDTASNDQRIEEILSNVGEKPNPPDKTFNPDHILSQLFEINPARNIDRFEIGRGTYNRMEDMGAEDVFRRVYAADSIAQVSARVGRVDAETGAIDREAATLSKAYEAVKADGGTKEGFTAYLLAQRTMDKAAQGIETGFNPFASKAFIADPEAVAQYSRGADLWSKWNSGDLEFYRDSGMISKDKHLSIWLKNPTYVSMRRIMGDDAAFGTGKAGGWGVAQTLRKMEGGTSRQIVEPILATLDNSRLMISMALKNMAREYVVARAEADPNVAAYLGLKKTDSWRDPNDDEIDAALKAYNFPEDQLEQAREAYGGLVGMRQESNLPKNEFVLFRDGKPSTYAVSDPDLANLLRNSGSREQTNAILKVTEGIASIQRTGILASPDFPIRVGGFHQWNQWIMDPLHPAPMLTLLKGLTHVLSQDALFDEAMGHGAMGAAMVDMDRDWLKEDMSKIFDETSVWDKTWNVVKDPRQLVGLARTLQRTIDESNRVGYYKTALDAGIAPQKAAMMARKGGLDYMERATIGFVNTLDANVAFLRPKRIGLKQGAEAFEDQGDGKGALGMATGTLWRAGIGVSLPVITAYAINYFMDKELPEGQRYADVPRWEKDSMLILPPIAGVRLKMRLPANFGLPFGGMVNRVLDMMVKHDPHAMDGILGTFLREYVPLGIPSAVQAPADIVSNYNFGTGTPLISDALKQRLPELQYTQNTSAPAIALAKLIGGGARAVGMQDGGVAPIQIDHLVQGWAGSAGIEAMRIVSAPFDKRPFDPGNLPGVGSFFVRNPGMQSQAIDDFYRDATHFQQEGGAFHFEKHEAKVGGTPDLNAFDPMQASPRAQAVVAKIEHALSVTRSVIEGVENNKAMNANEKRQHIDTLTAHAVVMAEYGVSVMHTIESRGASTDQRAARFQAAQDQMAASMRAPQNNTAPNAGMIASP